MDASYEAALVRTEAAAVADLGVRAGAVSRAEAFFGDMRADRIREEVSATYAPEAYLNDNIAVVEGAPAIGAYFAHTLSRVRSLNVQFLDVSHDGIDCFVRWRMTFVGDGMNGGDPVVSYGMTHFRFDTSGRILLHRDFWDAATGLYEYLPVLGPVLRRVRALAAGD
jgi:hypothetical protein